MTATQRRFFYGWVVVAVTALISITAAGVRSAPGVFLVPMLQDFQYDRGGISFAISLGLLLYGVTSPFAGALIDRFGPRRMMLGGMLLTAIAMFLSARMTARWELNLFWGVLSGIGTGMIAVLGATVANRWFVTRRGIVTGIFGASTSAGQLIFILLLAWLVNSIGWRQSTLILGGIALIALIPIFLFMRDDPRQLGLQPYGAPQNQPVAAQAAGAGETTRAVLRRAVRTPTFWLLTATFFVCGATSNGLIGVHFIPYAVDCGIGQVVAAGTLSIMGMFNFIGTLGSGWLTDRYDPRKLLAIYYGFRGLSLFLLPFTTNQTGLLVFAVLFGLDYIATVPPTITLTADTFGRRHVGTIYGWIFCAHQIGAASASWLGGNLREAVGSYGMAFLIGGGLAVTAAVLSLSIRQAKAAPAEAALA